MEVREQCSIHFAGEMQSIGLLGENGSRELRVTKEHGANDLSLLRVPDSQLESATYIQPVGDQYIHFGWDDTGRCFFFRCEI